jgi:hypothetical protein
MWRVEAPILGDALKDVGVGPIYSRLVMPLLETVVTPASLHVGILWFSIHYIPEEEDSKHTFVNTLQLEQ